MTELWAVLHALAAPFTDPASRTFLPSLAVAAAVGALWTASRVGADPRAWREAAGAAWTRWTGPSSRLDVQLLLVRQLLGVLVAGVGLGGAAGVALGVASGLDRALGPVSLDAVPAVVVVGGYTVALFVAWDLSRYLLHRLMHAVPALWALHRVHHSADVLTPLTFHRVHPLEGLLYRLRGVAVTGVVAGVGWWLVQDRAVQASLLGVHAVGLLCNAATGNLRHSHVWLRFPAPVERWLLSPAQHQLHHSADPADHGTNFGTWLAVWDRLGGSLRVAGDAPPARFGVDDGGSDYAADVVAALVDPLRGMVRGIGPRGRAVAVASLACTASSRAQEASEPAPEASPPDTEPTEAAEPSEAADSDLYVVVRTDGRVPRVAGSAHVVDEAELDRWGYDDVHRVLARVPGVYVRNEDGFGLRPNIGMRGANSDRSARVTLMEDGVLFGPSPYAAPAAYYFPMTARLTGIDVFKGPASVRFGPSTVGGAINVRTRDVPEDGVVASLDAAAGLYRTVRLHGHAGVGGPRAGILLEGVHLGTGGFKTLDDGAPTGFDRQEAMLKGFVGTDPERRVVHRLELKAGYARERSDETYLGLTRADFALTPYRRYAASALDVMRWQRSQAEVAWQVDVGDRLTVRTVGYHHWLTRGWFKLNRMGAGVPLHQLLQQDADAGGLAALYLGVLRGEVDSAGDDQLLWIGSNDRQYHSGGVQTVATVRAGGAGLVRSNTEIGLRVHVDDVVRLHTEAPHAMIAGTPVRADGDLLTTLDTTARALAVAAHVAEDLAIGPVRVSPGVRLEAIRTALGPTATASEGLGAAVWRVMPLPGVGLHAAATSWLDVFAGVHRGFSPVAPGQPAEVRPETSVNVEAGVRALPGEAFVEVVGFVNDYANLSGECTFSAGCTDDAIGRQFNGGAALVYGVEASASGRIGLGPGLALVPSGSYTYTGSRFDTAFVSGFPQFGSVAVGDRLPYVPEHQGSARLVFEHPRGDVAAGVTARGPMRDAAGQGQIPDPLRVPAMAVLDLATTVWVTRHVDATLTVTNLANTPFIASYRPYGARPEAPVSAMLGVRVHTAR